MILVFIFTCIAIFLVLSILAILLSTIRINIDNIEISNINPDNKIINDYTIYLGLFLFNKVKLINIPIDKDKVEKMPKDRMEKVKQKIKKMDIEELKNNKIKKEQIKRIVQKLKIRLEYFNLKTDIGTEDVIITAGLIATVSSVIGIGLSKVIKKYDSTKYSYIIQPVYQNKNIIKLSLKCIICIKMVHIIHIIYFLYKIRRVDKNERASNRRAYDYSYE